jgi:hypothetical protein
MTPPVLVRVMQVIPSAINSWRWLILKSPGAQGDFQKRFAEFRPLEKRGRGEIEVLAAGAITATTFGLGDLWIIT